MKKPMLVIEEADLEEIKRDLNTVKEMLVNYPNQSQKPQSIKQICLHLGKSRSTVFRYMKSYSMPFHYLGPDPVFYLLEIETWIKTPVTTKKSTCSK
jgi:predicted DNA-binding transcriptional regulator AlpA